MESFETRGVAWRRIRRGFYEAHITGVVIEIHTGGSRQYYACGAVGLQNQTIDDSFGLEQAAQFAFDSCHLRASVVSQVFFDALKREQELKG